MQALLCFLNYGGACTGQWCPDLCGDMSLYDSCPTSLSDKAPVGVPCPALPLFSSACSSLSSFQAIPMGTSSTGVSGVEATASEFALRACPVDDLGDCVGSLGVLLDKIQVAVEPRMPVKTETMPRHAIRTPLQAHGEVLAVHTRQIAINRTPSCNHYVCQKPGVTLIPSLALLKISQTIVYLACLFILKPTRQLKVTFSIRMRF